VQSRNTSGNKTAKGRANRDAVERLSP